MESSDFNHSGLTENDTKSVDGKSPRRIGLDYSVDHALMLIASDMFGVFSVYYVSSALVAAYSTSNTPKPTNIDVILVLVIWFVTFLRRAVYNFEREHYFVDDVKNVVIASVLASILFAGVQLLLGLSVSRELISLHAMLILPFLIAVRRFSYSFGKPQNSDQTHQSQGVLVIGGYEPEAKVASAIARVGKGDLTVIGCLASPEQGVGNMMTPARLLYEDLEKIISTRYISQVVIGSTDLKDEAIYDIIGLLSTLPVKIHVLTMDWRLQCYRPAVRHMEELSFFTLFNPAQTFYQRMVKRVLDLAGASLMLLMVLPVMAMIAIAIKIGSDGPILFRQERIGEKGRLFTMLKFRSMVENAEDLRSRVVEKDSAGNTIHKKPNDPRVTPIGLFLRHSSLDELPQLFNVLKGDMSLVGPRPEMPWLAKDYQPWQRRRFLVPQGITGWWQINGRSENPMHLSTEIDLYYVNHYSLLLDLKILLLTVPALVKGEGAY